jgi:antitoxin (DNA-binding transcriptional repressor) of toxin-antitoxin stability system
MQKRQRILDPERGLAILALMETTVLAARSQLSALLRRAQNGEEVIIRRGSGPEARAFQLIALRSEGGRSLEPDPCWAGKISFRDDDIWASEWAFDS